MSYRSFKSYLKPEIYRSLNKIYPDSFPVSHQRTIEDVHFVKTLTLLAKADIKDVNELKSELTDAINGVKNEFYGNIEGSTVCDDTDENSYFILIIFGMIIGFILFKIFILNFNHFKFY
jgi:hypothetical protein